MRQHARLARPGAGDDQQRPLGVQHGLALLRVERVEQGVGGGARRAHLAVARRGRAANALPYFRRQERWEGGGDVYRGGDGPLVTERSRYEDPLCDAYVDAAPRCRTCR